MKKKNIPLPKSGNNIQIDYVHLYPDNMAMNDYLTLKPILFDYNTKEDFVWEGDWKGEKIIAKCTKQFIDVSFSDNFPQVHKEKAIEEINRITNQFN